MSQESGCLQAVNQNRGQNRTADCRNQKRNHKYIKGKPRSALSHPKDGNRIGAETAEHRRAKHFSEQCSRNTFRLCIHEPAKQRAKHAAGKCHETADAEHIADQRSRKCHSEAISGPQQHRAEDIHRMLHRCAFAPESRKRKQTSQYRHRTEQTGQGHFPDIKPLHFDSLSFTEILNKKQEEATSGILLSKSQRKRSSYGGITHIRYKGRRSSFLSACHTSSPPIQFCLSIQQTVVRIQVIPHAPG